MFNMLNELEPPEAVGSFLATIVAISAYFTLIVIWGGAIFALYLGWRLALADDEQKRKSVKGQMVWAVLAVVVVAGIVGIWSAIQSILVTEEVGIGSVRDNNPVLHMADTLSGRLEWLFWTLFAVVGALSGLLAVYLGVQLATAQDEQKRRNAKGQMVYAILAFILVVGLMGVYAAFGSSLVGGGGGGGPDLGDGGDHGT